MTLYSSALGRPYTADEWAIVQVNLHALKKAQKRNGKGKRSLWTVEHDTIAKDGPHYDRDEQLAGDMRRLRLAETPRPDTLTKAAQRARDAVRRHRRGIIRLADPDAVPVEFERRTIHFMHLEGGAGIFARAAAKTGAKVYAGIVLRGDEVAAQVVLVVNDAGKVRASWPTGKPASAVVIINGVPGTHHVGVTAAKKFATEGNLP